MCNILKTQQFQDHTSTNQFCVCPHLGYFPYQKRYTVHCTKYINGSQRPFMAMGKSLYVIDNIRCFKSVDNGASFLNLIFIDLTKTAVNHPYFCHYTHRQSEILLGKIAFYEICFCIYARSCPYPNLSMLFLKNMCVH